MQKPKAKATKKAAAKPTKLVQSTLTGGKVAAKKRAKPDGDADDGVLDTTPPKKQKKAPAKKGTAGKPLAKIENDSMVLDDDDDNVVDLGNDAPAQNGTTKSKTATEMYQKLTQLEHIIRRPDTYIGSVERTDQKMWVFNKNEKLMENRTVSFVPGLYKIFDEILVNAADNSQRDSSMSYLKVTIDRESGEISVENNGKGIPVEIHEKEKVYIPELIFGHLLTGSNYDDNEKKTVGGRNGYGAKLTNIFSKRFTIELQDSTNGKRYKQTWTDNMGNMGPAKITANKSSDFVRVTFLPDYKRFGMENGIDDDLEALLYRRVYDMAGTVSGVKVYLNGEHLKVNFKSYCEMYAKAIAIERGDAATAEGEKPAAAKVEFDLRRFLPAGVVREQHCHHLGRYPCQLHRRSDLRGPWQGAQPQEERPLSEALSLPQSHLHLHQLPHRQSGFHFPDQGATDHQGQCVRLQMCPQRRLPEKGQGL
jgi:DNA topoisomerase-2